MRVDVAILAENGVTMSEAEAHPRFVGRTFAAMLDEISREFGVSFPADASDQKDLRLLALYETDLHAVPGVRGPGSAWARSTSASPRTRLTSVSRLPCASPVSPASSATASPPSSMWHGASPSPTCSSRRLAGRAMRRGLHRGRGFGDRGDRGAPRRLPRAGLHRHPPASPTNRARSSWRRAPRDLLPHGASLPGTRQTPKEYFDIALQHAHMGPVARGRQEYVRRSQSAAVPARSETTFPNIPFTWVGFSARPA